MTSIRFKSNDLCWAVVAVLASSGCVARETTLTLPPDPSVVFPDAEALAVVSDRGGVEDPDGGVVTPEAGLPDAVVDAGPQLTYWRDVYPIVFARCAFCHANEERDRLAGLPPIVTFAHTQAESPAFLGQTIAERMAARVLNGNGTAGSMPQNGSPFQAAMTLDERQTIVRWVQQGAVAGELPDGGVQFPDASPPEAGPPPLPWRNGPVASDAGVDGVRYIDVFANAGGNNTQPVTIPGRRTNYYCFVFTVPPHPNGVNGEYAIEFTPMLDNRRNVHHMEIYRQDPANPIDPVGGTSPADWHLNTAWDCEGRVSQEQLIANYVPGGPPTITLPRDVGYRIHAGDRLMLEIHFDSVAPPNMRDMSGIRITTTTTQAAIVNAGEFWVGPLFDRMDLAPAVNPMGTRVAISSECRITQPVTIFWIRPHMHERGRSQQFWVRRNGAPERNVLAEVNPWDVGNQPLFDVPAAEQQFNVGDVVGTRCEYETMGGDLIWGSGGDDEMCFFNMIHYPFTFTQDSCWTRCGEGSPDCPVEVNPQ